MKKILLVLSLLCGTLAAFGQSVSVGVRGGVSQATFASSGSNDYGKQSSLTSFSAGAFVDLKLGSISLQPGVFVTGKGGKIDLSSTTDGIKVMGNIKTNPTYAEVPVDLVYHIPIVIGNIYVGAGPYAALGISGKIKGSATGALVSDPALSQTMTIDENVFKSNEYAEFKKNDYGANFIAGVKFDGGFLVNVGYDLGLTNILSNSSILSSDIKFYTRTLSLTIGFSF